MKYEGETNKMENRYGVLQNNDNYLPTEYCKVGYAHKHQPYTYEGKFSGIRYIIVRANQQQMADTSIRQQYQVATIAR